jgi:hypothetical protein
MFPNDEYLLLHAYQQHLLHVVAVQLLLGSRVRGRLFV